MVVTVEQIDDDLMAIWPALYHKWMTSRIYWSPPIDDLSLVIQNLDISTLPFRKNYCECEAFARLLWAGVTRHLIDAANLLLDDGEELPDRLAYPWSIGVAKGLNLSSSNRIGTHDLVICRSENGIYLIEPQTNQRWRPVVSRDREKKDFIFKIDM